MNGDEHDRAVVLPCLLALLRQSGGDEAASTQPLPDRPCRAARRLNRTERASGSFEQLTGVLADGDVCEVFLGKPPDVGSEQA